MANAEQSSFMIERILGTSAASPPRPGVRTPRAHPSAPRPVTGDTAELSGRETVPPTPRVRSLRVMAAALALSGLAGCASMPGPTTWTPSASNLAAPITHEMQGRLLRGQEHCTAILPLSEANPQGPGYLSVHGLGTGPDAMAAVDQQALSEGRNVSTVAYREMTCSIGESGRDLAAQMAPWLQAHADHPIEITTHSLGGRIVLEALSELARDGKLPKTPIQLHLISPPLGGFGLLNLSLTMPPFLAKLIPGANPTRDLATHSGAQHRLRDIKLPDNVHTRIYYGTKDQLIDYTARDAVHVAKNLNAEVYYIAGRHHTEMVDAVAHGEAFQPASGVPPAYSPDPSVAGFFLR